MTEHGSSVLKDSLHTLAVRVFNVGIAMALGVLTARLLGPSERGVYVLPTLDAALPAAFFGGLGSATSYYMLSERKGRGTLPAAFISGLAFVIAGMALVAALGFAEHRPWTIVPAAVVLAPMAVTAIATGYCFGIHRVRYANYLGLLASLLTLIVMAAGLLLFSRSASVAIGMWVISTILTAFVAGAFLLMSSRRLEGSPVELRPYLRFAVQSGSANLLSILNLRIDVYIIAAMTSPRTLGIYTVAVAGAEALKIVTLVLSQTAGPRIGSTERTESARFTAKCVRNNLLIALVPCGLLVTLAPWLLNLVFGSKFLPGATALQILVIGIFASAPSAILSSYFTLKLGRPMVSFWNCGLSLAICFTFSLMLIPKLGMNGAAVASTVAYIVSQAALLWVFIRDTRLPLTTVLLVQRDDLLLFRRILLAAMQRIGHAHTL